MVPLHASGISGIDSLRGSRRFVRMAPGSTIRTLILKGETSATSASETPFSANLEAE